MEISKIKIRAEKQNVDLVNDNTELLQIQQHYVFKPAVRGEVVEAEEVTLDGNSLLEFQFNDDTVWICDPGTFDELFPEAAEEAKKRGDDPFEIPTEILTEDQQQRGIFKKITLKVLKVFTKKVAAGPLMRKKAEELEEKMLDEKRGLLWLNRDFKYSDNAVTNDGTYLLLLHGTAASTRKSFGDLFDNKGKNFDLWSYIFDTYKNNVLAFEHKSLTKSPLENVLELVTQLPQKATLDLMSQSRGGLVGDILCRFCIESNPGKGFSANEKNYLRKAKRLDDIEIIEKIESVMLGKSITIRKFVRVACPANGSTLSSKRLDIYLNVIFNLIGIALGQATNPIYVAFKDLIAAVVETKDDPDVLPGLEPQNPASPFNQMLNNALPDVEITSPLLVISGNNKFGFKWSAIKTVLSKVFFLGHNDFVVNTNSMYNGARRKDGRVQYFFDESPDVSHFNYYQNEKTRGAILAALSSDGDKPVPGFTALTGRDFTASEIRNINLGLPGGAVLPKEVSGRKPIVVLLPGIMGSNLSVKDEAVWINYLGFFEGRLANLKHSLENNVNVKATSLVGSSYKKLYGYLSSEYDVVSFPFDWRIKMEANTLVLNNKLLELMKYNQPIKLIGHSMGGVLIRDFILSHDDTWQKLNKIKDFRLLFLGAPLGGSFRIASVLFGEDSLIKKLDMMDLKNSRKDLLGVFSQFPGILSLLPLNTDPENDFADPETWDKMKDAFGDNNWPVPNEELLSEFKMYRDNILDRADSLDLSKAVYIAGQSKKDSETISGYKIVKRNKLFSSRLELEFQATDEGDESVTWESGIPKSMIAKGNVYFANVVHGELANDEKLFTAISEILKDGATVRLTKNKPITVRGGAREFKARTDFDFDLSPTGVEKTLMGLDNSQERFTPGEIPIAVTVTNGHLKYAIYPLLCGHFENDGILFAEGAIDYHLGGELKRRIDLGVYPGPIGTSESIETGKTREFKGGIIVGLGKQGEFNESQLIITIEKGIIKYLADLNGKVAYNGKEKEQKVKRVGISALIVGSGYGGLGIEGAVRAILQGIQNANKKILFIYKEAPKVVEAVEFIEIYKDRALACVKAVSQLEKDENHSLNLTRSGNSLKIQPGWRERLPVEDTQEWWTRINVQRYSNEDLAVDNNRRGLRFAISTDAARLEERTLLADSQTLFQLFEKMSKQDHWTPEMAKVVFEMLIPNDFKQQVKRQNNISWQLDGLTAAFPWELLQDSTANAKPLSVNAGMIRQLATVDFRQVVNSVSEAFALVVADPNLGNPAHQLKAAREEGTMVSKLLTSENYQVSEVIFGSAADIKINLYGKNYKIVHLAGHGTFSPNPQEPSGMIIGEDSYLTTADIDQMSGVPELVFVNCCYLGEKNEEADKYSHERYKLAANIGTQLIRIGVKAVVVAGWAVSDDAALEFAE